MCAFKTQAQLYTYENFNHKNGLTSSGILTVAEGPQGYIWFGTDGAGLIKYDGKEFDYLEDKQGKRKRHISAIAFGENQDVFFGTQYRGFFKFEKGKEYPIKGVSKLGQARGVFKLKDNLLVVQDASIELYRDSVLIDERKIYPLNVSMALYNTELIEGKLFLFTSRGNFIVHQNRIESLNDWLGTSSQLTDDLVNSYKKGDSLVMMNKLLNEEVTVLLDNFQPKFFIRDQINGDLLKEGEHVIKADFRKNFSIYLTNSGRLFKHLQKSNKIYELINNSDSKVSSPTDLLIDKNLDIWITTRRNGVFRVSLEPFTQFKIHEVYEHPNILFIHKTSNADIIISNLDRKTHIANRYSDNDFKEYDILVKGITEHEQRTLLASDEGLYEVKNSSLIPYKHPFFDNKVITHIYSSKEHLWVAVEADGLYSLSLSDGSYKKINNTAAYIYSSTEHPSDPNKLLFGGNTGVFELDTTDLSINSISSEVNGFELGYYAGNVTKDIYGTVWFSLDEGLLGILKNGKRVAIHKEVYLPSNLFYTLNADDLGNLIVGTNKGITVVKIDSTGTPRGSDTYNSENGFNGYETHMRSSFKDENGDLFVGTLEGLFLIRPRFLQESTAPAPPVLTKVQNKISEGNVDIYGESTFNLDENNFSFHFKSINSKTNFLKYSYRLVGLNDEWSPWTKKNNVIFSELKGGKYRFEVKARTGDHLESKVTSYNFRIYVPFYRTKWFIFLGIGIIIILNFYILEKTKNFNRKNIILSQDLETNKRMAASILLFGAIANTGSHIFASKIDTTIISNNTLSIIVGAVVLVLFLLLNFTKSFKDKAAQLLVVGFLLILSHNFLAAFLSEIHPFYLMAIVTTMAVTPVVFRRLKIVIALAFVSVLVAFYIAYAVEESFYNSFLFIVGVGVISVLVVLLTYIRNSSLEKLIFTSGVVNKGNALVVAFDKKGKISYASENIGDVLGINVAEIKGIPISELNQFQPKSEKEAKFSNVDLKNEFAEGKIFVTPIFNNSGDLSYYQWSCKEFSEDVRVILGQDVTEKINLENYYELIVNNADDLIYQTDTLGNFNFVNEKCIDSFKYSKADLLGHSFSLVIHPEHKERVGKFYREQFLNKTRNSYLEFPIINGEGETRWLGQNITTLLKPGTDEVVTGFLGLARDITEKRKANTIIKEQNKDITASINYARRIQFNMLPRSATFEKYFEEHFVLFKPKDIVSGDFYWLGEVDNKTILICSDSTGHGVPGSFMTLLGINILNQVILEAKVSDPGQILNQLDQRLIEVLPRDGRNRIQDGMEAVACVFDDQAETLHYATAGGRFGIANDNDNDLVIHKLDNKHIGDIDAASDFSYKSEKIPFTSDDILYLFTDGYPDQFGGERNKKLSIKKFVALLNGLRNQELSEQNLILLEHLKEWIGDYPQTDDITLIGIRGRKKNVK